MQKKDRADRALYTLTHDTFGARRAALLDACVFQRIRRPYVTKAANDKVKEDKCWKVRPWLSSLRSNMVVLPQEKKSAVDKILIPFCGRCYIRQYMPNKPKSKWGLNFGHVPGNQVCAMILMSTSAATKVFMAARVTTSLGWELLSCSSCVPAY
ncbi:hypothetical protein HPB51_029003 [Rhipicephalus microplus]|uniref:Uncharacterized protein n=1 Tax=Rhipicephalus microplus TaxID=6941 RepID=A0A9J6CVD4_RHIMP|nr:hypothetical protein HPB51_029003 [Rhipicephalus microplus]